jgi:hypothetical protein
MRFDFSHHFFDDERFADVIIRTPAPIRATYRSCGFSPSETKSDRHSIPDLLERVDSA